MIIAIEEAFSRPGMKMTEPESVQIVSSAVLKDWETRLDDITEARVRDMDDNGVDMQVLSLTVPGIQGIADRQEAIDAAVQSNDYLAQQMALAPSRFRGFAALPLQDPDAAVKELRRCVNDLGFRGALVNDHTNGHYLDEAQYDMVWSALEELDVPLYLHPGAPKADHWHLLEGHPEISGAVWAWGAEAGGHAARIIFGGVFDRHPKAKLVLGHMGEFLPFQLWRLDSRYHTIAKQSLKKAPSEYFKESIVITTSGVCSPETLAGAIAVMGEDSVLFAIDYPYESSKAAVDFLKAAPIEPACREKIAHGNAERLLNLSL